MGGLSCCAVHAVLVSWESVESLGDYRLQHKRKAWPLPAQSSDGSETVAYIVEEKGIECDIWHNLYNHSLLSPPYMDSEVELMQLGGVRWDIFYLAETSNVSGSELKLKCYSWTEGSLCKHDIFEASLSLDMFFFRKPKAIFIHFYLYTLFNRLDK